MKKNVLFVLSFCLTVTVSNMSAQVKPDGDNHEKHLYTFEDNEEDVIGDAEGELMETATVHDGVLDITDPTEFGGYLSLPADIIEINTYPELTIEAWATPSTSANSGNAVMMWCFGTYGNPGFRYLFFTPARWGINLAARLSSGPTEPWANEDGISVDWDKGDSTLHHYVLTIDANRIMTIYVDHSDSLRIDTMDATHGLDSIANDDAFIGRSVYSPDPTWKGTVELFSIWDIALSPEEVQWLQEEGPKRGPVVNGINSLTGIQSVNIYAINHRLYIQNVPDDLENLSVTMYSITGSIVYQSNDFQNGTYINLKHGMYMVKVESRNNNFVQKVIIN